MDSYKIKQEFIKYFKKQGHVEVPSSSLIPDNDPSVLLTTAGMQQFKPYFLGKKDPKKDFGASRLVSVQKSFRTSDIDYVGDQTHNTFFEMLGNFAIADYFKKETIDFAWELLTKTYHLDKDRLWATYYEGDKLIKKDIEAAGLWEKYLPKKRILGFGREDNWWGPPGKTGSCGPSSEVHFDITNQPCDLGFKCLPNCQCNRFVEVWNLVFTEYEKNSQGHFRLLETKNIDTGMGLERIALAAQKRTNIFETDLFSPILEILNKDDNYGQLESSSENIKRLRIVADHLRAAVFLINDGVNFSNKQQGYVLRRIVRRAIDQYESMDIDFAPIVKTIADVYQKSYPELSENTPGIVREIAKELDIYQRVLKADITIVYNKVKKQLSGKKEKIEESKPSSRSITAQEAFRLYTTYGFSPERIRQEGYEFDEAEFKKEFDRHQEVSRSQQPKAMFHGGLADHEPNTIRGHTATHLLQAALRQVLGDHVLQKGSNITADRVRFDFNHDQKMNEKQIKQVEEIVNQKIQEDLPVFKKMMTLDEANALGAMGLFEEKYGDKVSLYFIGSEDAKKAFSKEFCGGPHVTHTSLIGSFKIKKEESSSSGIRRIKALVGESLQPDLEKVKIETQ
ncbi:MAG: alanine--tRNA ligase [bacterium]